MLQRTYQQRVQARVDAVAQEVGLAPDYRATPTSDDDLSPYGMAADIVSNRVLYGRHILENPGIDGSIAHELGHFVHGLGLAVADPSASETFADAFASFHGFGEQLIQSLAYREEDSVCHSGCPHGALSDRIEMIRYLSRKAQEFKRNKGTPQ